MVEMVRKEDLEVGEYERLVYPSVFDYLTRGNDPDEQHYYKADNGDVWEMSYFGKEKSEELVKRMNALEYLSKKINMAEVLGIL